MSIPILSLLTLIAAIFIGYKRGVNTGLVGITLAFFVGLFAVGMTAKEVIAGFPTSLFLTLMGMTFLFAIAKVNNTLDLLATKVAYLAKGNAKLLPILFFLMSAVIAAVGPGPIVVTALMSPIALSVADQEDIPALLMASLVIAGSLAGGLSPITPSGIIASTLAAEIGIASYTPIFMRVALVSTIQGAVFYLAFGGLRLKGSGVSSEKPGAFDAQQKVTLGVILLVVVGILILGWDIGLTAFVGGTVLLLINPGMQKNAIAGISWPTLILVAGMAMLVNVVQVAGGIDYLSDTMASFMSPRVAPAVMSVLGGLMSAVSSASGVVMPTLIPTCGSLAESMGNVSVSALVAGVVIGAHAVTFSPLSTLGALAVSAAGSKTDKDRFFTQMLILGFGNIAFVAILGLLGLFG